MVSTATVGDQIEPSAFTEDADIRVISPPAPPTEAYANGYGNSKWAGEVLLREANDLCGLPVAVFRCDMILADSTYAGQLNLADTVTRMALSILATGIAPGSFYELDPDGNRQRAHFDGLPVEFVAEAIATLGAQVVDGFQTYHVMNPHDDGHGLDEFVDWLVEAGHPIERIDDFGEWLARLETGLRSLPDRQRQHSVLPLLMLRDSGYLDYLQPALNPVCDAVGTGVAGQGPGPFTFSHTATVGAYVVLAVVGQRQDRTCEFSSVTYGSQPMIPLGTAYLDNDPTNGTLALYGLADVPGGQQTVSFTENGSFYTVANTISYRNVSWVSPVAETVLWAGIGIGGVIADRDTVIRPADRSGVHVSGRWHHERSRRRHQSLDKHLRDRWGHRPRDQRGVGHHVLHRVPQRQ